MKRVLLSAALSSPLHAVVYQKPIEIVGSQKAHVIAGPMIAKDIAPIVGAIAQNQDKEITILISSPGGQLRAADMLSDIMASKKANGHTFTCIVIEIAASAAFDVLLNCDRRIIIGRAVLLFHPPLIQIQGRLNALQAADLLIDLQMLYDRLLADLQKKLPMDPVAVKLHFDRETFWYAETLDAQLNDPNFIEIYPAIKFVEPLSR